MEREDRLHQAADAWPAGTARAYRRAFVEALQDIPEGRISPVTVAWITSALAHVHGRRSAARLYRRMERLGMLSATLTAPQIGEGAEAPWAHILRRDAAAEEQVGGLDLGAIGEDEGELLGEGEGEGRTGGHPLSSPTPPLGILDTTPPSQSSGTFRSPVATKPESRSTETNIGRLPFWHPREPHSNAPRALQNDASQQVSKEHPGLTVFHLRSWMAVWDCPVDQAAYLLRSSIATVVEILGQPDERLLPLAMAGSLATMWGRHIDDFCGRPPASGRAVKVELYTTRDPRAKADMANHGLPIHELMFERHWSQLQREWAAWAREPDGRRLPLRFKGLDQERGVGCRVEHEPSGLWSYCDRWRTFDLNRWHAMKDLAIKMEGR